MKKIVEKNNCCNDDKAESVYKNTFARRDSVTKKFTDFNIIADDQSRDQFTSTLDRVI